MAEFRDVAADLAELAVNVGLMDSVSGHWPEDVQENWEREKQRIRDWAAQTGDEIMQFAESYDGHEGEEDESPQ